MGLRQFDEFKSSDSEVGHVHTSRFTNHLGVPMHSFDSNYIMIYTSAHNRNKFNQNQ